jgi:outer membrane biosynthesis protein TonB
MSTTARNLRIGIVYRGSIIHEETITRRTDVTVGRRAGSTVQVVASEHPDFPDQVEVLLLEGNAYHLVVPADPSARISLRGAAANDPKTLRGKRCLPAEAAAGGSVTIGDVTVMFQFVRGDATPSVTIERHVLRVGLVYDDRLISDRIFPDDKTVEVGNDRRATLVLPIEDYQGPGLRFVQRPGGETELHAPAQLKVTLRVGEGPTDLADLVAKGKARQQDGAIVCPLGPGASGRATLGGYNVLFQVVKQSVTVPALAKPSGVRRLSSVVMGDPVWAVSFAVALCLVAGVVGQAMLFHATTGKYLEQSAKAEEDQAHTTYEIQIEQKEEEKPPEPEPEDKKETVDVVPDEVKKAKPDKEAKVEKADKADKPTNDKPSNTADKQLNPEEVKRNAREAVQKNTLAGAFGQGAGTRLFGDAGDGEEGTVVAKTFGGTGGDGDGSGGPGSSGIKIANSGGGGSLEKASLGGKKTFERKAEATQVEVKKEEKKVEIKLASSEMGGEGEGKGDVAKVIARKNSAVQQCYEKALRDNPDEGGKVKVSFTVGTAGTVTDVSVSGASGSFGDCIKAKFMAIRGLPILGSPQSFNQSYVFSKN